MLNSTNMNSGRTEGKKVADPLVSIINRDGKFDLVKQSKLQHYVRTGYVVCLADAPARPRNEAPADKRPAVQTATFLARIIKVLRSLL